jgi:pyrrolidone-carboxylate peptidase
MVPSSRRSFLMGFIHIPPLPTQLEPDWRVKRGMSLEALVHAAEITLQVVTEFVQSARQPATRS